MNQVANGSEDVCLRWIIGGFATYVLIVVLAAVRLSLLGKDGIPFGFSAWRAESYSARGQRLLPWVRRLALGAPLVGVGLWAASVLCR